MRTTPVLATLSFRSEVAALTPAQVADTRADLEIKLRGRNVPRPIETWEQAGLPDAVLRILETRGLARPFAIQRQALPIIMSGALAGRGGEGG